jgi:dienelactone hydrolase
MNRRAFVLALCAAACDRACGSSSSSREGPVLALNDASSPIDGGADTGIRMRTWRPKTPGKHPAILLLHGAAGPSVFTDDENDHHVYPERFAQGGYAVFMPYYTHGGDPFALARGGFAKVARDPDVLADKIAVVGFSRGAAMGLKLAAEEPKVAALVELHGFMSDADAKKVKKMPPTFILHGEKDTEVDVREAYKLEKLFKQKKVAYEMHLYPDQGHGFDEPALGDSIARILDFLDRRVVRPAGPTDASAARARG